MTDANNLPNAAPDRASLLELALVFQPLVFLRLGTVAFGSGYVLASHGITRKATEP